MPAFTDAQLNSIDGKFFVAGQTRLVKLIDVIELTKKDGTLVKAGKSQMYRKTFIDAITGEEGEEVSTSLDAAIKPINAQVELDKTVLRVSCIESSNPRYPDFAVSIADPKEVEEEKAQRKAFNDAHPTEEAPTEQAFE